MENNNYFIYWKNEDKEGIFNIKFDDDYIVLKNMEGDFIDDIVLSNIILSWTPIKKVIEDVAHNYDGNYSHFDHYTHHNKDGSIDEIVSFTPNTLQYEKIIWHTSADEKFDRNMKIFIPDLFNYVEEFWEGKFSNTEPIDDLKTAAANLDEVDYVKF